MKSFVLNIAFVVLVAGRPENNGVEEESSSSLNPGEYLPPYQNVENHFPVEHSASGISGSEVFSPAFHQPQPQHPFVNKQIYLYSAPNEQTTLMKHFVLGRPQKNYRVVFVKAPAAGATKISAEYAPQEEKTVIYVLSQKQHEIEATDIATPVPTEPSKPDVFFIKYKTPEEAIHAQHQIQAQYDTLGGESEVFDEGILPVTSVEGSHNNRGGIPSSDVPGGIGNSYLPPTY